MYITLLKVNQTVLAHMLMSALPKFRNSIVSVVVYVSAGTPEDKLRLFIINLIGGTPMSDVCGFHLI